MTVEELIAELSKLPPSTVVWLHDASFGDSEVQWVWADDEKDPRVFIQ